MFLLLENYGVRNLEAVFAVLISTMGLSFAWMFADAQPSGKELLIGLLVPKLSSRTIRQAVGVVGCVIMPHNVFLHSALVQSRKIDPSKKGKVQEAINYYTIESSIALFVSFIINLCVTTVFAKGFYNTKQADSIGLVNAGQYLEKKYGGGFMPVLYIWGVGLLAAGQSSTITGTYAGQFIMGGFLNLRLKKWLRALITRSCAIVPTMIVALVFNKSEASLDVLNEWLNVLQSIQIPFALIPLLTLVSKEEVMGVFKIGQTLKKIAWSVAVLVMVINGYLLLDFFVAEVHGFLFGSIAITCTAAYVVFILYLMNHGNCLPSTWFTHIVNKGSDRIELSIDPGTWEPMDEDMVSLDPIEFHSEEEPYKNRIDSYQRTTGLTEAVQTCIGQLDGINVAIVVMDFKFIGGSMGSVVGEKITCLIENATKDFLPLIIVCASGGARMQEGSLSLMQITKISSALYDYQSNKKLFYVPILTS
ncbi:hypothetical protein E3N88_23307 [Mikania micrantha]|uniref:CoA carboxyltransferase N-terminal domain-containing protein n=1 Tax=Mikania micrantha TaxID=192012 RepID=A0A5N6NCX3_9ASTR|nr:hypothetical protein E3N88_23307 [Mikania micrantha]